MKRTVRFIEDDGDYVAGDFGDEGDKALADIASGDTIVVGMLVFDADAVSSDDRAYETRVSDALLDSLWCIDVPYAAINDCDKDITDWTTVQDEYLRTLAQTALTPVATDSGDVNRG